MSYSIIKKPMVYVLFAGLVLAVQPVNAMHGKVAQEPNSSSWLKIGACLAAGAVAACGLYAWHTYAQEKKDKEKKEQENIRGSAVPQAEKNQMLRWWAHAGPHLVNQDEKERHIAYWLKLGADAQSLTAPDLIGALSMGIRPSTLRLIFKHGIKPLVYNEVLIDRTFRGPCSDVRALLELDVDTSDTKYSAQNNNATLLEKIRGTCLFFKNSPIFLPLYFDRGLTREELVCYSLAQKKCKAILKSLYENMLRTITSRNIRRTIVEIALNPHIREDNTWIVNQYLGVENPGEDVG